MDDALARDEPTSIQRATQSEIQTPVTEEGLSDLPQLVLFVDNASGLPLNLQSAWLGGDACWNGDVVNVIQRRESLSFVAQREMGGIICYECGGETVAIGFQSEKCPTIFDSSDRTIPPGLFDEWLEIHRKTHGSFVTLLGSSGIDASLKTFGEGVSVVAKLRVGFKITGAASTPIRRDLSIRNSSLSETVIHPVSNGTCDTQRRNSLFSPRSSDSALDGAQSCSEHDLPTPNKHSPMPTPQGRAKKLLKPFSAFRKKSKETPRNSDTTASSHPSKPSQPIETPSDKNRFFDKAKAILSFNDSENDSILRQMEKNHEFGRSRRATAKKVFQQCRQIPINIDKFKNWTDRQKFAFGQIVGMCLAKLYRRDVELLGDYPGVQDSLGTALAQRHKEMMAVLLGVVALPQDLVESVNQQYGILHVAEGSIPEVHIFLEALGMEGELDKCCLIRDLTALLIASGSFDTRVLGFLKLFAIDISVVPEAVDEWASDAGKNLWETYQSQKGEKESGVAGWKILVGVVAGGLALGATGGLALAAAPAALGAVGSALAGGVTATASIVGLQGAGAMAATALTGIFATTTAFFAAVGPAGGIIVFGATGMGLTGYKLVNRWGDLSNFDFVPVRPESRISSLTVWKDVMVERIDLNLEDGSVITYGTANWSPSKCVVFDENEYMVGVSGTATENHDDVGLCGSLKVVTNLNRTKHFAGSAYDAMATRKFCFAAREGQAVSGFDFHHGNCLRVYSTPAGCKAKEGTGAVNWTLFVSGWVMNRSDFRAPWMKVREFFSESDHFCLEWENDNVIRLGHFLGDRIRSEIGDFAARAWVKSTVVAVGGGMIVWPWFVTKSLVDLDNDWILVMERAKLAGRCLASVLADSQEIGNRPVTLCGHSMGAVVIFHCLLELYELQKFHVVKDVILLGSPIPLNSTSVSLDTEIWARARAVVGGRFVNGYSGSDWLLAFLFRYMEWRLFVAGLQPIDGVPGIENVDLSPIVNSHEDYPKKCDLIMHYIGFY